MILHRAVERLGLLSPFRVGGIACLVSFVVGSIFIAVTFFLGPTAPPNDDVVSYLAGGIIALVLGAVGGGFWFWRLEERIEERKAQRIKDAEKQAEKDHEQALEDRWDLRQREREYGLEPYSFDDELDAEIQVRQARANSWVVRQRTKGQWYPPAEEKARSEYPHENCSCPKCDPDMSLLLRKAIAPELFISEPS